MPQGKYVRKLLRENEVEDALRKMQRLSTTEDHVRSVEILRVVHELVHDLRQAIEGRCRSYEMEGWNR